MARALLVRSQADKEIVEVKQENTRLLEEILKVTKLTNEIQI